MYGIHCLAPKHGCSPGDLILLSSSLQPSWGLVNLTPAQYTIGANSQRVNDEYKRSLPGQSMQELTNIETRVRQDLEKELLHLGMLSESPSN
ncbi:hypothetical protein ccbrp13_70900 [Ktedonobacteria bacterium brp13]|nr:hypothetical protein ccbrp13_70900 [Ktedonobacteria bacterium brp13]